MDPFTLVIFGVVTSAFCAGGILGIMYELSTYRKKMAVATVKLESAENRLNSKYGIIEKKIDASSDRLQVMEMLNQTKG
tara:strand:+ start:2291 stop:2527 length:237 start_codon:yes stop_codon:yes gene_type:complete